MPKVTMPKDHPSAALIVDGQRVERGHSIDVDDTTAESLADQGWTVAKPAKKATPVAKPAKKAAPVEKAAAKKSTEPDAPAGADTQET